MALTQDAQGLRKESRFLKVRAREVRGGLVIHGSSDGALPTPLLAQIGSLISERPLCLTCIATKVESDKLTVVRAVKHIVPPVQVAFDKPCPECRSTVGPMLSPATPNSLTPPGA